MIRYAMLVVFAAACDSSDANAVPPDRRPARVTCPQNGVTDERGQVLCVALGCISGDNEWPANCTTKGLCVYDECTIDDDCTNNGVCSCAGQTIRFGGSSKGNACVPSNCHVDNDCDSGICAPSRSKGRAFGVQGYYCHTPNDTCTSDAKCFDACAYDVNIGRWACITTQ